MPILSTTPPIQRTAGLTILIFGIVFATSLVADDAKPIVLARCTGVSSGLVARVRNHIETQLQIPVREIEIARTPVTDLDLKRSQNKFGKETYDIFNLPLKLVIYNLSL